MAKRPDSKDASKPKPREMPLEGAYGVERLVFFSDAVFAIAITLLALDIRLPTTIDMGSNADLARGLLSIWHQYLGFVISFLVIGLFWMGHHRKFAAIVRVDRRTMWFNLLLLMNIAFVPFPTAVLSESGTRTATIFYALTMVIAGLIMAALWRHVSGRAQLIDERLSPQQRRRELIGPLVTSGIFLFTIGTAFVDPALARFLWLLLIPALIIVR